MSRPFRDLIRDYIANPIQWEVVKTETLPSTARRNRGGFSVQELLLHKSTGEEMVRHTLLKSDGTIFGGALSPGLEVEEAIMVSLDRTDWEILDATADDWESLEQIFLLVCFEYRDADSTVAAHSGGTYRRVQNAVLLEEIADRVRNLVDKGLLASRQGEDGRAVTNQDDLSYVWKAWFRMSPQGKELWESSEYATVAEHE
jgi:hypothetical protein